MKYENAVIIQSHYASLYWRESQWFRRAKKTKQKRVGKTRMKASGWLKMFCKECHRVEPNKKTIVEIPTMATRIVVAKANMC